MECVGDRDLKIVERQLERKITNFLKVIKYCSFNFPVVILSYPVRENTPFPTIHYLTCPHLLREVSHLEEQGYISKLEVLVQQDAEIQRRLLNAHDEVRKKRSALLKGEDKHWEVVLNQVGSGGIKELTKLKCLHLHLADFLAGVDNPIGEIVYGMISQKECSNGHCAKFTI
ncbi:DUF501 domain-containing protein [Fervidobacterium thailandense]|uniref:DUF501 domain-containing protein n=1 Tax=Fervidobacterium thailandense TaxID=1008305 RepID=A0A1E3G663_9BACT|nr:DUF501 domain-containing protein [Fervidobacterium thailandense]ODN31363.1 hypothetical protein A4H02_00965 [Fervidobacterium thailandense]